LKPALHALPQLRVVAVLLLVEVVAEALVLLQEEEAVVAHLLVEREHPHPTAEAMKKKPVRDKALVPEELCLPEDQRPLQEDHLLEQVEDLVDHPQELVDHLLALEDHLQEQADPHPAHADHLLEPEDHPQALVDHLQELHPEVALHHQTSPCAHLAECVDADKPFRFASHYHVFYSSYPCLLF